MNCNKLKEDILSELKNSTNISDEKFKNNFINLLTEFTNPISKTPSFLDYVDQTRRNLYLSRLIIEITPKSNADLLILLEDLQRHLDSRFEESKQLFAQTFIETAENNSFKEQIKLVFDDVQLLTHDRIMLHYNRLITHFSPSPSDTDSIKMLYNRFQRKVFVLKELFIMEKARNSSEFNEEKGDRHFNNDNDPKRALVEYKTAYALAWKIKEKQVELRIKMAKCWQKMSGNESKNMEAIFYTLAAIKFAYEMIENDPKNNELIKLKNKALDFYKTLSGSETVIESKKMAEELLVEKMMDIYSDKTQKFQKYDEGLNFENDEQEFVELFDNNFTRLDIFPRPKDQSKIKEYLEILLTKNRPDSVVSRLNTFAEIYLRQKEYRSAENVESVKEWLTKIFNLTDMFIDHSLKDSNSNQQSFGKQQNEYESFKKQVVKSKLEDCLTTMNLNIALCHLLKGENINCLSKIIETKHLLELRHKNTQLNQRIPFNQSIQRLEIFDLLLNILGINIASEIKLLEAKSNKTPSEIYDLGRLHEMNADGEERANNYISSLAHWQNAHDKYEMSFQILKKSIVELVIEKEKKQDSLIDKNNEIEQRMNVAKRAANGKAKALLHLSKFKKMHDFLEAEGKFYKLNETPEYSYYLGKAHCKIYKYKEASEILEKVKQNMINNIGKLSADEDLFEYTFEIKHRITKDNELVGKLYSKTIKQTIEEFKVDTKMPQIDGSRKYTDYADYNILSIDGGGVRGIIPAMWLCELEKETKKPICSMFNMMSGTSVGAIIAGAMAVPEFNKITGIKTENTQNPMYPAYEILELFEGRSKDIFTRSKLTSFLGRIPLISKTVDLSDYINVKYTDYGRLKLFNDYFHKLKLSDSLTDLVIPAVKNNIMSTTNSFTRQKALKDLENPMLFECLMATSAAPMYFPPYEINGVKYLDGGIQMNNPSRSAYTEALSYGYHKEDIFVLSLGTGCHIADPMNLDFIYPSGFFWAANLQYGVLPSQEGNTDRQMYYDLGKEKYQRWQVWFENEIKLDKYDPPSLNILMETARQFIEELKMREDNYFNKLIERLSRKFE